jgi:vacuolar-type H+-ATPase subunit I/STV1
VVEGCTGRANTPDDNEEAAMTRASTHDEATREVVRLLNVVREAPEERVVRVVHTREEALAKLDAMLHEVRALRAEVHESMTSLRADIHDSVTDLRTDVQMVTASLTATKPSGG